MSSALLTSCVDDDDSKAEATLMFQGVLEKVIFNVDNEKNIMEDPSNGNGEETAQAVDTLEFLIDYITEYFVDQGIIGEGSIITETAKVNYNSTYAAQLLCYQQAEEKYTAKLAKVSLLEIKRFIYSHHTEELNKKGYNDYMDVPFESINVVINYYSASEIGPIVYNRIYK